MLLFVTMENEKETKQTDTRGEANSTSSQSNFETPTILEKSQEVIAEMKKANEERLALIEREERMRANDMLAGRSSAGTAEQPKEETAKEYAKRVMTGEL